MREFQDQVLTFAFVGEFNLAKMKKRKRFCEEYIFLEESQIDSFCNEYKNKHKSASLFSYGTIIYIKKLSTDQNYLVKMKYVGYDDWYIQAEITILQGTAEDIAMALVAALLTDICDLGGYEIREVLDGQISKFVALDDINTIVEEFQRIGLNGMGPMDFCLNICDANPEYGLLDYNETVLSYLNETYLYDQIYCGLASYTGEIYPPKLYLFMR